MTKIKLVDGTIINASKVEMSHGGALHITTAEHTVEELAEIFANESNTNLITLMTESEKECGYRIGFTSFSGINYDTDGNKTVELFQPANVTEARIANAEATANMANMSAYNLATEVTDTQMAIAELAEMLVGGAE